MKMKKLAICLAAGLLVLGSGLAAKLNEEHKSLEAAKAEAVQTFNADIRGGARMTYAAGTNTEWTWLNQSMMNQDCSGGGIYVRMRNYTGVKTPIAVQLGDTDENFVGLFSKCHIS